MLGVRRPLADRARGPYIHVLILPPPRTKTILVRKGGAIAPPTRGKFTVPLGSARMSPRVTIVAHHGVEACLPVDDTYNLFIRPETFAGQMDWLARRRQVVALDAAVAGDTRPGRPAVAITFDDGYRRCSSTPRRSSPPMGSPPRCSCQQSGLATATDGTRRAGRPSTSWTRRSSSRSRAKECVSRATVMPTWTCPHAPKAKHAPTSMLRSKC